MFDLIILSGQHVPGTVAKSLSETSLILILTPPYERGTIISPNFQVRKLRQRGNPSTLLYLVGVFSSTWTLALSCHCSHPHDVHLCAADVPSGPLFGPPAWIQHTDCTDHMDSPKNLSPTCTDVLRAPSHACSCPSPALHTGPQALGKATEPGQ